MCAAQSRCSRALKKITKRTDADIKLVQNKHNYKECNIIKYLIQFSRKIFINGDLEKMNYSFTTENSDYFPDLMLRESNDSLLRQDYSYDRRAPSSHRSWTNKLKASVNALRFLGHLNRNHFEPTYQTPFLKLNKDHEVLDNSSINSSVRMLIADLKDASTKKSPFSNNNPHEFINEEDSSIGTHCGIHQMPIAHSFRTNLFVLDIHEGSCSYKNLSRTQTLSLISNINPESTFNGKLKPINNNDIRRMVSIQTTLRPFMQINSNGITFCLPPFRCIIQRFRVILIFTVSDMVDRETNWIINCENDMSFKSSWSLENIVHLCSHLNDGIDAPDKPYELLILEILCAQFCFLAHTRMIQIQKVSRALIESIFNHLSGSIRVLEVSELKRKLDTAADFTKGLEGILTNIINHDKALHSLALYWEQFFTESKFHSNIETLRENFEPYEHEVTILHKLMAREHSDLEYALEMVQLHLASTRNKLLKSELGLDIINVSLAFIAAIAGIFGMNLVSGWEEINGIFWPVSIVLVSTILMAFLTILYLFKSVKL